MRLTATRGRSTTTSASVNSAPPAGMIPFVYAASFPYRGEPGRVIQDVIAVANDSPFVATSISHGFEQFRGQPVGNQPIVVPAATPSMTLGALPLANIPLIHLLTGIRLNTRYLRTLLATDPRLVDQEGVLPVERGLSPEPFGRDFLRASAFERVEPAANASFLLSIVDSASGRELQDQPVFSLSSLGEGGGRRPFRPLAQPFFLERRSTLRLQVTEDTPGVSGVLHIALHGFKVLSSANCPTPPLPGVPPPLPGRAIPFDYVARLTLGGIPGTRVEREIQVEAGQAFRITSIGYGLNTPATEVPLERLTLTTGRLFDLGAVRVDQIPADAWVDGIRIRPTALRFAVTPGGGLNPGAPEFIANSIFERLNNPGDVSFRYQISDGGIGRDLQNQTLHNLAGLGNSTGERPFLQLARPWQLGPRSTVQVQVEEGFGRGELHIAFHGYRLPAQPGGRA
jgi:hypothetical protein